MRIRVVSLLVVLASTLGLTFAIAPAASADESFTVRNVTNNCGIITCSAYLTRSSTKSLDNFLDNKVAKWGKWGAEGVACGAMGMIPYVGVPLGIYCGFRFEQFDQVIDEAAEEEKCFKVTYTKPAPGVGVFTQPQVTHISTNNGKFCKD